MFVLYFFNDFDIFFTVYSLYLQILSFEIMHNSLEKVLEFEDKIRRKEMEKSMSSDAVTKPIESIDELDRYVMEGLGYDMEKMEALVRELTPEQSLALENIDFTGRVGITAEMMASELRWSRNVRQSRMTASTVCSPSTLSTSQTLHSRGRLRRRRRTDGFGRREKRVRRRYG